MRTTRRLHSASFLLPCLPPPSSSTLFPYTTLFRSDPVTGVVVHPAGEHHREHLPGGDPGEHLLAGERVGAAGGEGRGHDREVGDGGEHRAAFDVTAHHVGEIGRAHV